MDFIHFGRRMEIERLYLEWCEEEGIANKPNSFVVFLMSKGWLNERKIIEDLKDRKYDPQTETEIVREIIHKIIDNTEIAEDAYPNLRKRLHDAVDEYELQTEDEILREQCRAFMDIVKYTESEDE